MPRLSQAEIRNNAIAFVHEWKDEASERAESASRRPQSTLERLLKQSGTKTRDSATLIPDEPNTWGVIRLDLDIVE